MPCLDIPVFHEYLLLQIFYSCFICLLQWLFKALRLKFFRLFFPTRAIFSWNLIRNNIDGKIFLGNIAVIIGIGWLLAIWVGVDSFFFVHFYLHFKAFLCC